MLNKAIKVVFVVLAKANGQDTDIGANFVSEGVNCLEKTMHMLLV